MHNGILSALSAPRPHPAGEPKQQMNGRLQHLRSSPRLLPSPQHKQAAAVRPLHPPDTNPYAHPDPNQTHDASGKNTCTWYVKRVCGQGLHGPSRYLQARAEYGIAPGLTSKQRSRLHRMPLTAMTGVG